ncbi:hypothetical protein D910_08719, partial [Dendroctonus ponderosae]
TSSPSYTLSGSSSPSKECYFLKQPDLNNLVRDFGLTKSKAQLLGSRLKQWNLIGTRREYFSSYLSEENNLALCNDPAGHLEELSFPENYDEEILFIDASMISLKPWDSRARDKHYKVKTWPQGKSLTPGLKNVSQQPLVPSDKIFLQPLHLKLGLMKNFVKAIKKDVILLSAYKALGCNFGLNLDVFPENLVAVSDEHGERFHQDIMYLERRYNGKWSEAMLADFCWSIRRENSMETMKEKNYKIT